MVIHPSGMYRTAGEEKMRMMTRIAMCAAYVVAGWPGVSLLGDAIAPLAANGAEIDMYWDNEHSWVEEKENRSE